MERPIMTLAVNLSRLAIRVSRAAMEGTVAVAKEYNEEKIRCTTIFCFVLF